MKLFKRKFLIFSLLCCLGVQPIALPKEELNYAQYYFRDMAKDSLLSDITAVTYWTYQFIGKICVAMLVLKFLNVIHKELSKVKVQAQPKKGSREIVQNDIVNSELVQKEEAQIY